MFQKINRILRNRLDFNLLFCHRLCVNSANKVLYPLYQRKLLKVSGNDASVFLQGLITNDMRHFDSGSKTIYTMFLNNKGRVLYDTLIHKWESENTFMIECDEIVVSLLKKHLNLFKLKRQVNINDESKNYKIWAFISNEICEKNQELCDLKVYKDPRLSDLGYRLIAGSAFSESQIKEVVDADTCVADSLSYKYLRYKLGVSEGAEDLPPGTTFPLEVNCDYLHGVSFHKGCYIGQELTARVYHTGVVRKRIMAIKFNEDIKEMIQMDTKISAANNPKSSIGKLKGCIKNYGIGLVRIKEALEAKVLNIGKYSAEIIKPTWWPIEAPKEINVKVE